MKMPEIKKKAKSMGLNSARMKKPDLIRAIQTAEGNTPCFETGTAGCPHLDCCWREDCVEAH
jgi:hypothetical protein